MEDHRDRAVAGRLALFGSMAAVIGLLIYDVTVASVPSLSFGTATLGAGGALAPLSHNHGVPQLLLAIVLLAFSGFIGGVIVGHLSHISVGSRSESRVLRFVSTASLGAAAVGVGSVWLGVVPFGIAFLLSASVGEVLFALVGYLVFGFVGGAIVGVAGAAWPPRDRGARRQSSSAGDAVQAGFAWVLSKPVTVSLALSWFVVPGLLMAAAAVEPVASEIVISVGGSVFFAFWAAFALAAIVNLGGVSISAGKVAIYLLGIPAGILAALVGNSLCHAVGSGSLGEPVATSSLEGMFLFWLSVPVGAIAGLLSAPIAHLIFGSLRREWTAKPEGELRTGPFIPTRFGAIVLAVLVLVLFSASLNARFQVESSDRLLNAVFEGDYETAEKSLSAGADPSHIALTGWTPLSAAVDKNRPRFVRLLLREGADPGNRGRTYSLLIRAIELESAEVVDSLLRAGVDPSKAGFQGYRPIETGAGNFEIVRLLLEAGAVPDERGNRSPLQTAISKGNSEGARLMLAAGAEPDPEVRSPRFKPIYIAIERGYTDLLNDLITRGAIFDWDSEDAWELLSEVAERGQTDVVAFLIDHGVDMDAGLPLHEALGNSHEETAILLIEKGADVHLTNERGSTPLHIAARYRLFAVSELLLNRGANANAVTIDGDTPLHYVCGTNSESRTREMIELLLSYGADAHIHNEARQTAYDESSRYEKKIIDEFEDVRRAQQASH